MPAKHGGQTSKIKRVVGKTVRAINSLLSKIHKISSTEKSFVIFFYRTGAILRCTFALNIGTMQLNGCKARKAKSQWCTYTKDIRRKVHRVKLATVILGIYSTEIWF